MYVLASMIHEQSHSEACTESAKIITRRSDVSRCLEGHPKPVPRWLSTKRRSLIRKDKDKDSSAICARTFTPRSRLSKIFSNHATSFGAVYARLGSRNTFEDVVPFRKIVETGGRGSLLNHERASKRASERASEWP